MTKKRIITYLIVAIALIILAIFVFRNLNETPPVAVEQTVTTVPASDVDAEPVQPLRTATFEGTSTAYWANGSAEIIETADGPLLSFKEDFGVAEGPDLLVYLSPNGAGEDVGAFASLGPLKANSGEQVYNLPENYKDYKTIVIWCRAFSVPFAFAELQE